MRNKTIDAFRGLIMLLMAIDHVSYFILKTHFYEGYDYLTPHRAWLPFLTRFMTHICAPGFFFALGYGAYHMYHKKEGFHFDLLKRGLFLILLQFTIINFIWHNEIIYVGVIFVLGCSLIGLNLLMPLLKKHGLWIGLTLIVFSQIVISETTLINSDHPLVRFFLVPGNYKNFYVLYVITPWLGLSVLGAHLAAKPQIHYFTYGFLLLILFITIRSIGTFGNTHQNFKTLIDFLNVNKYPPSLAFLTLTMGMNFTLMGWINLYKSKFLNPLITFGQSALLFYILHLALYALIGNILTVKSYPQMYLLWLSSLPLLYLPCRYLNKRQVTDWFRK